jgi:hypothetical protein
VVGAAHPFLRTPRWALPPLAALFDALRAVGLKLPVDGNQTRLGGQDIFFDCSKAWAELGKPQLDMRQSIIDTYNWYHEHGYIKDDFLAQFIDALAR